MIRTEDLDECIEEAERFIKKARRVKHLRQQEIKRNPAADILTDIHGFNSEVAAAKRASLDLTKALARLRQPWRDEK